MPAAARLGGIEDPRCSRKNSLRRSSDWLQNLAKTTQGFPTANATASAATLPPTQAPPTTPAAGRSADTACVSGPICSPRTHGRPRNRGRFPPPRVPYPLQAARHIHRSGHEVKPYTCARRRTHAIAHTPAYTHARTRPCHAHTTTHVSTDGPSETAAAGAGAGPGAVPGAGRDATFAMYGGGLLSGTFSGVSVNQQHLRAPTLETPVGTYTDAKLRTGDVLFTRFELTRAEVDAIRAARARGAERGAEVSSSVPPPTPDTSTTDGSSELNSSGREGEKALEATQQDEPERNPASAVAAVPVAATLTTAALAADPVPASKEREVEGEEEEEEGRH